MRDTLLLVLACVGGTSVILTGCLAMWVAGNACVDWYDRIVKERAQNVRLERARARAAIIDRGRRPRASIFAEGWASYSTIDELIAESSRRAGARGESDG